MCEEVIAEKLPGGQTLVPYIHVGRLCSSSNLCLMPIMQGPVPSVNANDHAVGNSESHDIA